MRQSIRPVAQADFPTRQVKLASKQSRVESEENGTLSLRILVKAVRDEVLYGEMSIFVSIELKVESDGRTEQERGVDM